MQVLCEKSNTSSDVRCDVCGQSFLVYWERTSAAERMEAKAEVLRALKGHHQEETSGHHAHPESRFTVPNWSGNPSYSGAAMLGGAPTPQLLEG